LDYLDDTYPPELLLIYQFLELPQVNHNLKENNILKKKKKKKKFKFKIKVFNIFDIKYLYNLNKISIYKLIII